MTTTLRFAALAAALLGLAAAPASAQEDEQSARHHFRLGEAHYESGAFEEAAHEFEEAYRLSERPALLYNIFVAYRDAGMLEPAVDALRRYVELAPDAPNAEMARSRLRAMERTLARQSASGGDDAGDSEATTDGPGDEPDDLDADGDPGAEAGDPLEATGDEPTAPRGSEGGASGGGGLSPVGFIVGGAGAALMIGGAITGGLALSEQSALEADCPNRRCPSGYDVEGRTSTGEALSITTDVLLGVGGAALATGVVLIFVLQEGGDDPQAAAACGPDGCAVGVRGRF
ncbi:MAG TPA: tetratricopeptide repeat protein [Sandaracinaceae bacterium LLY-WYZ-13_1]|nr:tetratricopeptide repeat protein [Sandaracinaceae bacterium LLY-WYZ-13_1]